MVNHTKVPTSWTNRDRVSYVKIGKKRKEEHVAAYAVIAMGGQLFFNTSKQAAHTSTPTNVHTK